MEFNDLEFIWARDVKCTLHIFVVVVAVVFFIYKLAMQHFSPESNSFLGGVYGIFRFRLAAEKWAKKRAIFLKYFKTSWKLYYAFYNQRSNLSGNKSVCWKLREWLKLRESRAIHRIYVTCCKTSFPWGR